MMQSTGGVTQGQIWEVVAAAVTDSGDSTRVEFEREEAAFRGYQEESTRVIANLKEQIFQLQNQIAAERSFSESALSTHSAKILALNGQVAIATTLLNQVKQTNQQLNAQIAATTADNAAIQGRINNLISPAGQDAVFSKVHARICSSLGF